MVEGGGFEPPKAEPADLQSDPFDRSGTPPLRDALKDGHYDAFYHNCQLQAIKTKTMMYKIHEWLSTSEKLNLLNH